MLVLSLFSLACAIYISLSLAAIALWEMQFSKESTKKISHTLWLDDLAQDWLHLNFEISWQINHDLFWDLRRKVVMGLLNNFQLQTT